MYNLIYGMKQQGKALVIISAELTELIGMSDRLIILKNGKQTGEFTHSRESPQRKTVITSSSSPVPAARRTLS